MHSEKKGKILWMSLSIHSLTLMNATISRAHNCQKQVPFSSRPMKSSPVNYFELKLISVDIFHLCGTPQCIIMLRSCPSCSSVLIRFPRASILIFREKSYFIIHPLYFLRKIPTNIQSSDLNINLFAQFMFFCNTH